MSFLTYRHKKTSNHRSTTHQLAEYLTEKSPAPAPDPQQDSPNGEYRDSYSAKKGNSLRRLSETRMQRRKNLPQSPSPEEDLSQNLQDPPQERDIREQVGAAHEPPPRSSDNTDKVTSIFSTKARHSYRNLRLHGRHHRISERRTEHRTVQKSDPPFKTGSINAIRRHHDITQGVLTPLPEIRSISSISWKWTPTSPADAPFTEAGTACNHEHHQVTFPPTSPPALKKPFDPGSLIPPGSVPVWRRRQRPRSDSVDLGHGTSTNKKGNSSTVTTEPRINTSTGIGTGAQNPRNIHRSTTLHPSPSPHTYAHAHAYARPPRSWSQRYTFPVPSASHSACHCQNQTQNRNRNRD